MCKNIIIWFLFVITIITLSADCIVAQRKNIVDYRYAEVIQKNTNADYKLFLSQFPNSKYTEEINAKLLSLKDLKIDSKKESKIDSLNESLKKIKAGMTLKEIDSTLGLNLDYDSAIIKMFLPESPASEGSLADMFGEMTYNYKNIYDFVFTKGHLIRYSLSKQILKEQSDLK